MMMRSRLPLVKAGPVQRGFTLVELIIVIVLTALVGGAVVVFLRPTINAYADNRSRSSISDLADTALRRMVRDIRVAVPNSIRTPDVNCFELVPTIAGGRYRMGPESATGGTAKYVDTSQPTTVFDVLTPLPVTPAPNDFVVINNQNGNDVYDSTSATPVRSTITAVSTPAANQGTLRISINSLQVQPGYNGGRFQVVSQSQQSVFYVCSGADDTLDGNGNGRGTLFRVTRNFTATYPTACPSTSGSNVAVLATGVRRCRFLYDPNQGATQQSGFVWLELAIARNGETATLAHGAHVINVP